MRRLRIVTVAVVALTAAACGSPVSPSRSELARAEARWESAGIASYTAESRIHCFCPGHLAVWTRLTIRGNQVVETEPLEPLPPGSFATPLGWQTVADLFDQSIGTDERTRERRWCERSARMASGVIGQGRDEIVRLVLRLLLQQAGDRRSQAALARIERIEPALAFLLGQFERGLQQRQQIFQVAGIERLHRKGVAVLFVVTAIVRDPRSDDKRSRSVAVYLQRHGHWPQLQLRS